MAVISMQMEKSNQQGNSIISNKTVGVCGTLIALALVAITVFKVPVGTLAFAGLLLACPLLHVWMMRDGGHKH